MSLDTFANLKTAIASLLNRTDLTSYIPDFITLAESAMNARLNVRQQVTYESITLNSEFVALPSDFNGVRSLQITSISPVTQLQFASPEKIAEMAQRDYTATGQPLFYSIVGSNLQLIPVPDGTYTGRLTYYQNIPALATNSTNWLLTAYPGAYLYGSALQAAPFLIDDDRLPMWSSMFEQIMGNIEANDSIQDFGGRLTMRARTFG